MQDYLSGYLQVLPSYQQEQIQNVLKSNQGLYSISAMTEADFAAIVKRLAEDHQPLTTNIPQVDKLDDGLYNQFFSNMYMDLNLLFLESIMIENATANYERIFDGILSDLNNEINTLREKVDSLRLTSEGEDGLIVVKRSFENSTEMEDPNKFPSLFVDRGSTTPVKPASFERKHDQYFIALSKTMEVDALRNAQGNVTATVQIEDRRGTPVEADGRYSLDKAIDGSTETYWAEVVLVDIPINMQMPKA